MSRIKGKLALITGASAGIGLACARRFAADGANLVLWARRADRLEQVSAELTKGGVRVLTGVVDVRDRAAVNRAAAALLKAGAVPDILLNNAGLAAGLAKLQEGDPEDWEGMNLDVAGTKIRVSSIAPGRVEAEFATVRFHGDAAKAKAVYEGFRPLAPDDVADTVGYVVNLPEHVNILDLILLPTQQRNVFVIDRTGR